MKKTFLVALAMVLVSSLILSGCAASEGQEVNFPDKNLEERVRQELGKSAGEKITTTELAELTELACYSSDITDLSGLEYCTSLTALRLDGNQISDISPLANLTNLTKLDLAFNQISDISPLANLTNLTVLYLWFNQISDISPLANLTSLKVLDLRCNQISDISPLVENSGLGAGYPRFAECPILLNDNNLDLAEGSDDMANIRALEARRGVLVAY